MSESTLPNASPELEHREALLQIVNGYMISQCVYAAAKLAIADLLKDGPKTSDELAAATDAHPRSLYRILRSLAGFGIFEEDRDGRFSLTPMAELLRDVPGSLRDWAIMRGDAFLWRPWGEILHSVKTGESALIHVFGQDWPEYLAQHPDTSKLFDGAMRSLSQQKFEAVVQAYDFSGVNALIDVGGGNGGLITSILRSNPDLNGILVDLPHVVENAKKHIDDDGLSDRCETVAANVFERVPEGADAYIMANFIQNFDDDRAVKALQKCRSAMKDGGRILLIEILVPGPNEPHFSRLSDIEMLVGTDGGRERSKDEYGALYEAAGLRLTRVVSTNSPWSIVEGMVG